MADWMPVLVAQAWQVTLLIVVVAAINRWAGKSRPHLAHALWLVVLVKCVTPPVWSSPSGLFCWLQPTRETIREPLADESPSRNWSDLIATARHSQSVAAAPHEDAWVESDVEVEELLLGIGEAGNPVEELPSPITTDKVDWPRVLLGAWALVSLIVIAVAVVRWLRCWRMLRNFPQRECSELSEQLDSLAKQLKLRRRVRLIVTESRLGPAVIGLFRTTVLLPALIVDRLAQRSPVAERQGYDSPLALILAHELLHIRRGDLWVGLLQTLAQAVWWCHPLVWWVNRRTTREAERCCDEEVLAELGCDPATYARALVDVLELKRELKPVPVFPGVRPVEVTSQRLERIMQLGQGCQRRTPWWCWLLAALAAAATWPGAAFVVTAEDAKNTELSQPAETTRKLSTGVGVNSDSGVIGEVVLEKPNGSPAMPPEIADKIPANEFWPAVQAWLTILGPIPEGSIAEVRVQGNRLVTTDEFLAMIQSKQGEPINEAQIRKDVRALLATRRFMSVVPRFERSDKGPVLVFRVIERSVIERVEFSGNKQIATEDLEKVAELRAGSLFEVSVCSEVARRLTKHYRSKGFSTARIYPKFEPTKGGQLRDYKVIFVIVEGAERKVQPPSETQQPAAKETKLELDGLGQLHWQHSSWFVAILPAPGTKLINTGELPNKFRSNGQVSVILSKTAEGFSSKDQIFISADELELSTDEDGQEFRLKGDVRMRGNGFHASCDSTLLKTEPNPTEHEPEIIAVLNGPVRIRQQANSEKSELTSNRVLLLLHGTAITQTKSGENGLVAVLRDPPGREDPSLRLGLNFISEKLVSANFESVPLVEAIKQLAHNSGRKIVLEKPGLEEEGLTSQSTVTLAVDQVKFSSALKLLLHPLNLGYRVEESGVIVVTSQQRLKGQPVVVTYSVADLAAPIPKRATMKLNADQSGASVAAKPSDPAKSMNLRLPELVELITSTCQPNSWAAVGGNGQIKANDPTLSLVVRQTQDVHDEIRGLLEQQRRLLDLQAALHVETLTVPADFWHKVGKDFDDPNVAGQPIPQPQDKSTPRSIIRLTKKEAALLRSLSKTESVPKVTLFNGQEVEVLFGGATPTMRLALKSVVSADRTALRLQAAATKPDAELDFAKMPSFVVQDGHSLLLDVTELYSVGPTSGLPILGNLPDEARLFKNSGKSDHRTLLLITGQVVIVEEEAE